MNEEKKPVVAGDIDLSGVDNIFHEHIRDMIHKHEIIWSGRLDDMNVAEHVIDLKDCAKPFKLAPYQCEPTARKLKSFELKKHLETGLIRPSVSEWVAPALFVPKKDGQLSFSGGLPCAERNDTETKLSSTLHGRLDCIDSLGQTRVFSTPDAYFGYWKMNIGKVDRSKTATVTHSRTYQYICMAFSFTNAPVSFQCALNAILTK